MQSTPGRDQPQTEERAFSCRLESSKAVTQVLLRLCNHNARKDQECRIEVTKDSITFLVTGTYAHHISAGICSLPLSHAMLRKGQDH